jgi:hypothetical protein
MVDLLAEGGSRLGARWHPPGWRRQEWVTGPAGTVVVTLGHGVQGAHHSEPQDTQAHLEHNTSQLQSVHAFCFTLQDTVRNTERVGSRRTAVVLGTDCTE